MNTVTIISTKSTNVSVDQQNIFHNSLIHPSLMSFFKQNDKTFVDFSLLNVRLSLICISK